MGREERSLSKQLAAAITVLCTAVFLGWYSGINFVERGFNQAWWVCICIAATGMAYTYPGFKK
jgi:uncharacterized oligopeptide transporter (OPT) family protein